MATPYTVYDGNGKAVCLAKCLKDAKRFIAILIDIQNTHPEKNYKLPFTYKPFSCGR